jgi:hypothetical protein
VRAAEFDDNLTDARHGAIILTGYLGGAVATYVRLGEWYPPLVPFTTAVLAWLGLFLREPRLWVLLPFRRRS